MEENDAPLPRAEAKVKGNLQAIARGEKPPMVAVGQFTTQQLNDINAVRRGLQLHEVESPEILYIGRHHYESRRKDGYSIKDMWLQIRSALADTSTVHANPRMTALETSSDRDDGYGNRVRDRAVFECTQRKPRAELYSVTPKGDTNKPRNAKGSPRGEPSRDDPG